METGVYSRLAFIFTCAIFALIRALFHAQLLMHMARIGSNYYEKANVVEGDRVDKAIWMPSIGKELPVPTRRHQ